MFDIIIDILALILLFFLPGLFLVLILFPRPRQLNEDYDLMFKVLLAIALSVIISVGLAIVLNSLDMLEATTGIRSFRLYILMLVLTFWLGVISWRFGGLKDFIVFIRKRPTLRIESPSNELSRLTLEKRRLQQKLASLESEDYNFDQALKEEANVRIPMIKKQIDEMNSRIDTLINQEEKTEEMKS